MFTERLAISLTYSLIRFCKKKKNETKKKPTQKKKKKKKLTNTVVPLATFVAISGVVCMESLMKGFPSLHYNSG